MLVVQERNAVEELISERGLECVIGERHVVVPLRFVDQLIEYPRASLPLARQGVAGLGVYQGKLLVSLSMGAKSPAIATKAVLLRALAPAVSFALEVDRTLSFVDLSAGTALEQASPPEPWLSHMTSADGRHVLRLDVEALVSPYLATKGRS
jgi:CheW-like domain